jgi:hypothetical protein
MKRSVEGKGMELVVIVLSVNDENVKIFCCKDENEY